MQELASSMFSKKDQRAIVKKVKQVVEGLPESLKQKTVEPVRGASGRLSGNRDAIEIKVGSGYRAAVVLDHNRQVAIVYMVGTHDYARARYLSALDRTANG
jgi:hypothetical protein